MQPHEVGAGELLANLSVGYIVLAAAVLTIIRLALVPNRTPLARSVAELVESLIIAGVLVFLVIRPFFLQAFYIPSESMEPTLMGHKKGYNPATDQTYTDDVNDRIFVNKLLYRFREPDHGDIIVFRAPKEADVSAQMSGAKPVENVLIKRLIGKPGDTIEVKGGQVWRNGKPLVEPYVKDKMSVEQPGGARFATEGAARKLGPDELFVMGDNRNHSNDSRFWGPLKRDRVIGKASLIFWPLGRVRLIR
jgi:signal peptidase I